MLNIILFIGIEIKSTISCKFSIYMCKFKFKFWLKYRWIQFKNHRIFSSWMQHLNFHLLLNYNLFGKVIFTTKNEFHLDLVFVPKSIICLGSDRVKNPQLFYRFGFLSLSLIACMPCLARIKVLMFHFLFKPPNR